VVYPARHLTAAGQGGSAVLRITLTCVVAALDIPAPPCPECRMRGVGGRARIGNARNHCGTCNRFAQQVARTTRKLLIEAVTAEEYERIRLRAELASYPGVLANFLAMYPAAGEEPADE